MHFFSKVVYKKIKLPFAYVEEETDYDAGVFSIEAIDDIDDEKKYFYMSFILTNSYMYDSGDYEELINLLKNSRDKEIDLLLKYKKNKLVGFEIERGALASSMNDSRFESIELSFSSISSTPRN